MKTLTLVTKISTRETCGDSPQVLANFIWRRFTKEYFPSLIEKKTWKEKKLNLKEGDVVLAAEPNKSRGVWLLGRIVSSHPGQEGTKSCHGSYSVRGVQKTNHESVC